MRLEEVDEDMRFICHLSPDAGWPSLSDFLGGTANAYGRNVRLHRTPHRQGVKDAVKAGRAGFNLVIQHGSATEGDAKKDDIPDEEVVEPVSAAAPLPLQAGLGIGQRAEPPVRLGLSHQGGGQGRSGILAIQRKLAIVEPARHRPGRRR